MTELFDLVIIGGGPAGLSAAIYMARAKYRVLVLEKEKFGGQITITSEVVNYPGIERISGTKLTESMRNQAENFGAEFALGEVIDMDLDKEIKIIRTKAKDYKALSVIIATGANPRRLGFPGEKEFQGRGVAYCATCDGEFFTGMDVFVIGGGFAAAEEGMFLTRFAKKVHMIIREPDFTCAKSIADEVRENEKIEITYNTEIKEAGGSGMLQYAEFYNNETGETWRYEAEDNTTFGIFVFAGYVPSTGMVKDKVALDQAGYIITDNKQNTSVPGVCAAGDVCIKDLRQVVTAVSDGAIAATTLEKHVAAMYEKLDIERPQLEQKKRQDNNHEAAGIKENKEQHFGEFENDKNMFIDSSMKEQLISIFSKFQNEVLLRVYLDERAISEEIQRFVKELVSITDKISYEVITDTAKDQKLPYIELCKADGTSFGTGFHGVPGGHEFNSFILALYNAAGPGQPLEESLKEKIQSIHTSLNFKVIISLSCTMCPELVTSAQRLALLNENITTEVFDMAHFGELREQYKIMSVPCFIINDRAVHFGKKNVEELLEYALQETL